MNNENVNIIVEENNQNIPQEFDDSSITIEENVEFQQEKPVVNEEVQTHHYVAPKYSRNFGKSYGAFFKNAILFVLFSIFNGTIPVALVALVSYTDQLLPTQLWEGVNVGYGTQPAMAIGYIAAIQIGFVQIAWTMSIASIYVFSYFQAKKGIFAINRKDNFGSLYHNCYTLTTFYSIIFTPICIIVAVLYNNFAVGHINTLNGQTEGWWYIMGAIIYNLLIGYLFSSLVLIQYKISSLLAIVLALLSFALIGGGLFAGTYIPKYVSSLGFDSNKVNNFLQNTYHVGLWSGLGMSAGLLASLFIVAIICACTIRRYAKTGFLTSSEFARTFKKTWKQLFTIAMIQIFKGIAICGIAIQMGSDVYQAISLNYQLGRSIWYIILYLIPCISYGLMDSITYYGLTHSDADYRNLIAIAAITSCVSIILSAGVAVLLYMFLYNTDGVNGLINFLVINNTNSGAQLNVWIQKYLSDPTNLKEVNISYLLNTMLKNKDYLAKVTALANDKNLLIQTLVDKAGIDQQKATMAAGLIQPSLKQMVNVDTRQKGINSFIVTLGSLDKLMPKLHIKQKFITLLFTKMSEINADSIWYKMFYLNFGPDKTITLADGQTLRANGYNLTFFYLAMWTMLYPSGAIMNNARLVTRGYQLKLKEFLFVSLIQAFVIGFTVGFGIAMQNTTGLELYNAWSVLIGIMGPVAFLYYSVKFAINNKVLRTTYKSLATYAIEANNPGANKLVSLYV